MLNSPPENLERKACVREQRKPFSPLSGGRNSPYSSLSDADETESRNLSTAFANNTFLSRRC